MPKLHPLVGGHLTFPKGHLTIPKRAERIARYQVIQTDLFGMVK